MEFKIKQAMLGWATIWFVVILIYLALTSKGDLTTEDLLLLLGSPIIGAIQVALYMGMLAIGEAIGSVWIKISNCTWKR